MLDEYIYAAVERGRMRVKTGYGPRRMPTFPYSVNTLANIEEAAKCRVESERVLTRGRRDSSLPGKRRGWAPVPQGLPTRPRTPRGPPVSLRHVRRMSTSALLNRYTTTCICLEHCPKTIAIAFVHIRFVK